MRNNGISSALPTVLPVAERREAERSEADRSAGAGKTVAAEPDRDNFELLAENCGPYKNITCLLAGLAATECTLTISNKTSASPWAFRTTPADSSTDSLAVPGSTFSTILRQFGLQRIDLLKLDIEGAECEIFECSDLSWLDHVGAIAPIFEWRAH